MGIQGGGTGSPTFYLEAKMLRTMQELQDIFRQTINQFNEVEREKQEKRLSEEFFEMWKAKAEKEEGETNVRCLRFTFKSEFDLFCDKEIESIKMFCKESKLEILISWLGWQHHGGMRRLEWGAASWPRCGVTISSLFWRIQPPSRHESTRLFYISSNMSPNICDVVMILKSIVLLISLFSYIVYIWMLIFLCLIQLIDTTIILYMSLKMKSFMWGCMVHLGQLASKIYVYLVLINASMTVFNFNRC